MWRFLLLLTLPFASCYTYQFFTLKSDRLPENPGHEYVFENDTLRITYNFNGEDCPVTLSFYNKSYKPLLIDWKKSAVIVNDTATSLYSNAYQINGQETGARFGHVYSANLSGKVVGHEETAFIPPNALITRSLVNIKVKPMDITEFTSDKKLEMVNQTPIKFQKKDFDKQSTPFRFRNFLTFRFQGEDKEFSIENAFYVSTVKLTTASPWVVGDTSRNTFFIKTSL